MKVYVETTTDELLPLRHHLALEGCSIVNNEKESELVISETNTLVRDDRFIYSHIEFPHAILKALNLDVVFSETKYFFTKWYDYKQGWGKQTFLGIPIHGFMDGGLGRETTTSVCGRYVEGYKTPDIFTSDILHGFLNDLCCRGFVTIEFSAHHEITIIRTGVPYGGLYNILEGAKGTLVEFLLNPFENRLIESWTSNVLVSRYPFPFELSCNKISIHNVTPEVEAHVWFYDIDRFRRSISTKSTKVARVTAWGQSLSESNRRVLRTAFELSIPLKQFRLDSSRVAGGVYDDLLAAGIV